MREVGVEGSSCVYPTNKTECVEWSEFVVIFAIDLGSKPFRAPGRRTGRRVEMQRDGDLDDEPALLPDISPEVFGGFSSEPDLIVPECAPTDLRIVQTIASEGSNNRPVLLWNSAVALSWAWWAGRLPPPRNARVLDLGAGLGVCSLTAAALDAKVVVATEIEPALTVRFERPS